MSHNLNFWKSFSVIGRTGILSVLSSIGFSSSMIVCHHAMGQTIAQHISQDSGPQIIDRDPNTAQADSVITPIQRASPIAIATYKKSTIYIKVTYGQPLKRGREIFGKLEPYGQIWRTGSNEATEVTTTQDLQIGNKVLKAGTYTLFTVPDKDKWKIIFNSDLGQWGAYTYDPSKDVLTTEVTSTNAEQLYEAFFITFNQIPTGVEMILTWDKTKVVIPMTFVN
ncbi:DUF2911 domain-containing protein [Cytophagaceae bacterium DM2B3-1]|uniref:DUF2911 domain-containing protein n=1 Tax=Xanthocytophaga flava TaxID=3048013 RepID=A0ABT7CEL9_9BACT|nr:DUF2911 domain-containing protein [Xanthocytophaga flavus]MDJ1469006.1 DUF2911 domain-containing protein [Xanthocytophaga flavus]MDJ1492184.1 DUF2911 domain-containing protein [Xanthocytophaga flavus]